MNNLDLVRYKRNFLDQVIVRLDFQDFINSDRIFFDELDHTILENFPYRGKQQIVKYNSFNVKVNILDSKVKDASGNSVEGNRCEYLAANKKNKVIISNKSLVFEINEYSTFDDLIDSMDSILYLFFDAVNVNIIRTGIRYINLYDSRQIRLQKNYFIPEISASLIIKNMEDKNGMNLVQSIHRKEFRDEFKILNFRYGMYNPDYPNPLKCNSFLLDFDCYNEEIMNNYEDIRDFLKSGHAEIQSFFEMSITDYLRKELNNE